MRRFGRQWDPTVDLYGHPCWGVLMAYLERRSVQGCAKGLRMPEDSMQWRLEGHTLVGTPGYCLARSTRPPEPGRLEEFGLAWLGLGEDQRRMLVDCVELANHPWLRGTAWRKRLGPRGWGLSPRNYERLLMLAWRQLVSAYRQRRESETVE